MTWQALLAMLLFSRAFEICLFTQIIEYETLDVVEMRHMLRSAIPHLVLSMDEFLSKFPLLVTLSGLWHCITFAWQKLSTVLNQANPGYSGIQVTVW